MTKTLIIYSRYPEAGKTKTRMIPELGAEGAAELQSKMTEHTLHTARKLKDEFNINIELHFAGGNEQLMSAWLGKDIKYIPQVNGDLGNRMNSSFTQSFENDSKRVVIIGIDCPDIDIKILNSAFQALHQKELVLGVAEDGGYYLIGLNKTVPQLFKNINWGTEKVLEQTKAIAHKLNLQTEYLPTLSDVDRPENLPIWTKHLN